MRSLTLIEPPLYHLVPGDPEVERLERIGDAVLREGLDADPELLRAFLRVAGAAVPCLVASGDHTPGLERICDALAVALDAQRLVAPGAGHFVAAAPGFAERFERFLAKGDPV